MLKVFAKDWHLSPNEVLDATPFARLWVMFVPTKIRRQIDGDRLRELRNQQRIKAGKPPILPTKG